MDICPLKIYKITFTKMADYSRSYLEESYEDKFKCSLRKCKDKTMIIFVTEMNKGYIHFIHNGKKCFYYEKLGIFYNFNLFTSVE